jgi:hypothetical protein
MADRSLVPELLSLVVPSDYGDERFARLTGGSWHPGGGTTCAFLGAFVLFGLGCRDPQIVNYEAPTEGVRFHVSEGVSRLVSGAKALGAWRPGVEGVRAGDALFLSNGPPLSEHIAIYVEGSTSGGAWRTADAGQRNGAGQQCARFVNRTFNAGAGTLSSLAGPKVVQGYVCLDAIPTTAAPLVGGGGLGWLALLAALGAGAYYVTRE